MNIRVYGFLGLAAVILSACGDDSGGTIPDFGRDVVDQEISSETATGDDVMQESLPDIPPPSVKPPETPLEAASGMLVQLDGIATAIENVTDETSAQTAVETIATINKELEALVTATEGMGQVQMMMAFASKTDEFMAVQDRMSTAMQKLQNDPALMQMIAAEIAKMPSVADEQ